MTYILMSHEASPAGIYFGGEFSPGKTKKSSSATHTKDFSLKTMPKSPDFNSKNSEIALAIYYTIMEHVVTIYIS
jgi:hypothetical protein